MSSALEEQSMELEALESIFGEDFVRIGEDVPSQFNVMIRPCQETGGENHVLLTLSVQFSAGYPEELPNFSFENVKGLSVEQCAELRNAVDETAVSSLGMAMVYSLVEVIQEYLIAHNHPEQSMHTEMMERLEKNDPAASEDDGDSGDEKNEFEVEERMLAEKPLVAAEERVSIEQFTEWKLAFKNEMMNTGIWKRSDRESGKLTGKALFEKDHSLITSDSLAAEAPAEEEDAGAGGKVFWKNAAVFGDDLDAELPDD